MSDEQNPMPKKGRVIEGQVPKILQGGGPVMIFGAKRPTSVIENAASSNPNVPTVDHQADQASGQSDDSVESN